MTLLRNNAKIHVLLIALAVLITRILYLCFPAGRIGDADEAVFGMMAQGIEALKEFPIYCWEAHYAGAPVSYVAALIFHFFGPGFVQLRLAMLPAALFTPILFYFIYRKMFESTEALAGALFLIFCPFFVLYHTMAAHGGYGETYFGTALIIMLSWRIRENNVETRVSYLAFLLGFVCGFFFYILFLVLPAIIAFALPSILRAEKHRNKTILSFAAGGIIGVLPLIVYNNINSGGTLLRAAGRSLSVGREAINTPTMELIGQILSGKIAYLKTWLMSAPGMLGQYVLPEFFGGWILGIAGLFLAILFIGFVISAFINIEMSREKTFYLRQFSAFFIFLILFQWVANLNRARHLLPLLAIIPVAFFTLTRHRFLWKKVAIGTMCLICVLHVIGWSIKMQHTGFDPRPVVEVMKEKRIKEFYGSYWTTYPIMFSSNGELIGSPYLLPYNEILSDRRPNFTKQVRSSLSPAFIFGGGEQRLKDNLQQFLIENSIKSKSIEIGSTTIFWELSKPVHAMIKSHWETSFVLGRSL